MDFEGLAELLVPLAFFGIIGGLIALRMLKPYGDKILQLIKEIQKDRHEALSETRDLQHVRDRLDMLAERQDFLEALVENRLDEDEQEELERIRRRELGRGTGDPASRDVDARLGDRTSAAGEGETARGGAGDASGAKGGEA